MARRGWLSKGRCAQHARRRGVPPGGAAVKEAAAAPPRIFLLSPASSHGERARLVFRPEAQFPARPGPAHAGGRSSRRRVHVPQRPLLPRQARLRARVRAAAGGRARGRGHHHQRRAASRRNRRSTLERLRRWAAVPIDARRGAVPRSARARRRAHRRRGRARGARWSSWAASPAGSTWTCSWRSSATASCSRPTFVGRGDMSRGGLHAPLHGLPEGAGLRARGHVRPARRASAALAAAPAPAAGGGMSATRARPKKKAEPRVTRNRHPATTRRAARPSPRASSAEAAAVLALPRDVDNVEVRLGPRSVRLTNLRKPFWPALGITKGDLIQYYADVSPALLPHLHDRAMVMKRYPHGAAGEFFFMKRAPAPRPDWIEICSIEHESGQRHRLPDDPGPAVAPLGRQPRLHRPQPVVRALRRRRPARLRPLRPRSGQGRRRPCRSSACARPRSSCTTACEALGMPAYAKTTGSRGIHVYVPIVRGPDAEGRLELRQALRGRAWRRCIRP